jgi:hypothetical protein
VNAGDAFAKVVPAETENLVTPIRLFATHDAGDGDHAKVERVQDEVMDGVVELRFGEEFAFAEWQ